MIKLLRVIGRIVSKVESGLSWFWERFKVGAVTIITVVFFTVCLFFLFPGLIGLGLSDYSTKNFEKGSDEAKGLFVLESLLYILNVVWITVVAYVFS